MEKVRKATKKTPVPRVSLAREAWINNILLILAAVIIGLGVYFSFQPGLIKRSDIKLYNQGVAAYYLASELLPATDERPQEYSIVRAAAYFQQAALESTDDNLKSLAFYNLGTLMGGDALSNISGNNPWFGLSDAITKLEQSVRADPNNEDAKYNLELLEKIQATMVQTSGRTGGGIIPPMDYQMASDYSAGDVPIGY